MEQEPHYEQQEPAVVEEVLQRKRILTETTSMENLMAMQKKIRAFADAVQEKFPDYQEYRLYHALIGSTPGTSLEKMDFPGEFSVVSFIEELEQEFGDNTEDDA